MLLYRLRMIVGRFKLGGKCPCEQKLIHACISVFSRVIKLEQNMEHDLSLPLSQFAKSMYNNGSWTNIYH